MSNIDNLIEEAKDEDRQLSDGIYDVTGIEVINVEAADVEVEAFIWKYPKFWVASAYETDTTLLVATKPTKLVTKDIVIGSGFNYGSTNVIRNCPKDILILAEND